MAGKREKPEEIGKAWQIQPSESTQLLTLGAANGYLPELKLFDEQITLLLVRHKVVNSRRDIHSPISP